MADRPPDTVALIRTVFVLATLVAALASPLPLAAQTPPADSPVLFRADELHYDRDRGIVEAAGHVEISVDDTILLADEVSYNEQTDTVVATGNISILQPSGDVLFADHVELQDNLRTGFLTGFRALLSDRSRFAAVGAQRIGGNRLEMTRVVYSACHLSETDRERAPLWQIKAFRVTHDQARQRIDYQDLVLEFFGLPVAYLPYFSHADPSVKRKSGFLTPTYGSSSRLGLRLEVPYYFNIAPNRDATFAPLFTSKENVVLAGEYRERVRNGQFIADASLTRVDERDNNNVKTGDEEVRGHIFSSGRFELNETWSTGYAIARATDDTYLRRYDFSDDDTLTSNAFIEGFRGRNYAAANIFAFQGLREEDDPGQTPLILPLLDFNYLGVPGHRGQRASLDANLLALTRDEGTDTQRLSLDAGWQLPYTSAIGEIYTLSANLRGDLYFVDDVVASNDPTAAREDGFAGRLYPRLALDWRLPFVREDRVSRQVIEPVVTAIVAPNGGNPTDIPNEDSVSFEFDDANVFSLNRFPGLDRVEGGARINYGFRAGAYHSGSQYATARVGQVFHLNDDDTFADKTGLEEQRSDYVGAINFVPSSFIDYSHRFRLDRDSLSIRRHEIQLTAGPEFLRVSAGYISLDRELTTQELESREELSLSGRAQLARYWAITADTRRDLTDNGGTLKYGFGLIYQDECLIFTVGYERDFTEDRDVRPSTTLTFRIKLKNIG